MSSHCLDLEAAPTSSGESEIPNKTKKKRAKDEPDIDFTKALDNEPLNNFAPPKNPKSLLLPASRSICSNKLPEDCHYRPESLIKLFLLPDVLVMFISHTTVGASPAVQFKKQCLFLMKIVLLRT